MPSSRANLPAVPLGVPRTRKGWGARSRHWLRRFWRAMVVVQDTPHRIALGAAIGLFVGWLPIMGIQMIVAFAAAWILRANLIATVPPVWISNVLTVVPMYFGAYWVGALFIGGDYSFADFSGKMSEVMAMPFLDAVWRFFVVLGDYMVPMMLGGTLIGLACAIPLYAVIRRATIRYQARMENLRASWRAQNATNTTAPAEPNVPNDVHQPGGAA